MQPPLMILVVAVHDLEFAYNPPMPDEQYYALANLVKRPMRRLWARVGSWWMVGLAILLVSEGALSSLAFPVPLDSSWRNQVMINWPIFYLLNERLVWVTPAISVGVALLCATNALVVVEKVTHNTLAYSESVLRKYKYKLALVSCWPALLPAFIWSLIGILSLPTQYCDPITAWRLLTISHAWFHMFPIWVVWLVAITTVTRKTRWPAWAYYLCGLVAYRAIGTFRRGHASILFSQPLEFSNLELTIFTVVGLVLIYGVFSLFLFKNYKYANLICIAHCLVLLLAGINVRFGILQVDYIIHAGSHLPEGLKLLEFWYSNINEPVLKIRLGAFISEYPAGPAWAIVPILNGVFWLFAHYFAFSWLMGRDWRKRGKQGNIG